MVCGSLVLTDLEDGVGRVGRAAKYFDSCITRILLMAMKVLGRGHHPLTLSEPTKVIHSLKSTSVLNKPKTSSRMKTSTVA